MEAEHLQKIAIQEALKEQQDRAEAYKEWMVGYCERVIPNLEKQLLGCKTESKKTKINWRLEKWKTIQKSILATQFTQASKTECLSSAQEMDSPPIPVTPSI